VKQEEERDPGDTNELAHISYEEKPHLFHTAYLKHVMLLYHTDEERNAAAVDYINEGLKSDHLCVYASVSAYDSASKWHYSNLSSRIENFEENIKQGNLVIVDFKPLFEAARKGDLALVNQLKSQLETMLNVRVSEGRGDKILAFADAACILSENKEFEECIKLENWWHNTHEEWTKNSSQKNITVICPHPASVFNEETTTHAKARIAEVHSVMLEAPQRHYQQHQSAAVARPIRRVLIAEPERDIQMLYPLYLESLGLEVTIVSTSDKCLDSVFNAVDSEGFDTIILDTHLKEMSGMEVARKIKQRLPDQRILITSTIVSADEIEHLGMSKDDILQKPFHFSKLLDWIKPEKKGARAAVAMNHFPEDT
jgi:CheY-like chemotaxis protein